MRTPKTKAAILSLLLVLVLQGSAGAGGTVLKSEDNFKATASVDLEKANPLSGKLVIEIEAFKGWKVSHEAPMVIEVTAPEGVRLAKGRLRNADMATPKAEKPRFEVPFTVPAKGSYNFKLKFDVVLCTEQMCQKKRFESALTVAAG